MSVRNQAIVWGLFVFVLVLLLAYLRLLGGWGERWRYATGYFAPDVAYEAQHGRSGWRARWRYVVAKLRSRSA